MPWDIRAAMEDLFGADFGDVRFAAGPDAHRLGATALTMGAFVFQGPAPLQLKSAPGMAHLAHELAHVIQQRTGRVTNPFGAGTTAIVQDPAHEAEARRYATRAATQFGRTMVPVAIQAKVGDRARRANDLLDDFVTALDAIVQKSRQEVMGDPLNLPVQNGYITRWQNLYYAYLGMKDEDLDTKGPPFLNTAFGYAVESLSNHYINTDNLKAQLPPGYKILTQFSKGHTRPDVVVVNDQNEDIGWFDITCNEGHIFDKQHAGWTTRPYVAEILYEPLDPAYLGSPGPNAPLAAKLRQARKAAKEDWDARMNALSERLQYIKNQMGTSRSANRDTAELFLGTFFGLGESVTPNTARSLISFAYAEHKGPTLGTFGYTKTHASGRDRHTALELLDSLDL